MTTNVPFELPPVILDSAKIADGLARESINPQDVREDEQVSNALKTGQIDVAFLRGAAGQAFNAAYTEPTEESSAIAFDRHFNPYLKKDSTYFGAVNKFISCVEKN